MIRIQHFRRVNALGEIQHNGGFTIAYSYEFNRHSNNKADSVVEFSTALCSPHDPFVRAEGTRQARKRFADGHTVMLPVKDRDLSTFTDMLRTLVGGGPLAVVEDLDLDPAFHEEVEQALA